ncbi:hypothetical protein SSBR45G_64090 [Bradyrhizobium sp. SSBR45G]|nr:hypothetical protein SSBR45G_64090 [Bradyrhizobium sp. SSBR45G]GLH88907.1 hypothetical protein SSBR45R_63680 [Bradyrhizobium sp. SSBR45R]
MMLLEHSGRASPAVSELRPAADGGLGSRAIAFEVRSFALVSLPGVMAGPVPAIHVVRHAGNDVDARDKPGHDGATNWHALLPQWPDVFKCDSPGLGKGATFGGHFHRTGGHLPETMDRRRSHAYRAGWFDDLTEG